MVHKLYDIPPFYKRNTKQDIALNTTINWSWDEVLCKIIYQCLSFSANLV